jgi:FkbM family methyltransferase
MKHKINHLIELFIKYLIELIQLSKIGRYFLDKIYNRISNISYQIKYKGIDLKFSTPNNLCLWRAKTFSNKEPETLDWIDNFQQNSVFWDIGANVGLYSVYAAKKCNSRVYAFEPSVLNLETLARNINLNYLVNKVCIIPFPLNDSLGFSKMKLTSFDLGGALSTFDKDFGWDGNPLNNVVLEYLTIGLSMEDALSLLKIPQPSYIKIDVDGLEHFILKGGGMVLKNTKQILIEINDFFSEQSEKCSYLLNDFGFILDKKCQSDMINKLDNEFKGSFNQIWINQLV